MPIVPDSTRASAVKKGGRIDLQALLLKTNIHPKGRVQIDPLTGMIRNPKNNVLFMKKMKVKADGVTIGVRDVAVNGGHAKKEGSVWRMPLNGPSRYHWKVMADDHRFMYQGKSDRTAPELMPEEMEEYQLYRAYLKETDVKITETTLNEVDAAFYDWLGKQDRTKIKLLPMAIYRQNAPTETPVS